MIGPWPSPNKLLNEGEHVVVTTRTHPKVLLLPAAGAGADAGRGRVPAAGWARATPPTSGTSCVWIVAALVIVWWVVRPVVTWATTTYTFTNRRFIKRSGLIAKEGRTIPLNRISGVDFEIGVIDRIFGCGTLVVSDASEQGRVELARHPAGRAGAAEGRRRAAPASADRGTRPRGRWTPDGPEPAPRRARAGDPRRGAGRSTRSRWPSETGVTIDQLRRLWRALGLPRARPRGRLHPADAGAVSTLTGIVESGVIDFDLGGEPHPRRRPDDGPAGRLGGRDAGPPGRGAGAGRRRRPAAAPARRMRMVEQINPPFEQLLIYAWRRHLAAAVARVEALGANEEDLHTTQVTRRLRRHRQLHALSNQIERGPDRRPRRDLRVPLRRRRRRRSAAG